MDRERVVGIDSGEAQQLLEATVARRVAVRRNLCAAAVQAAAQDAERIVQDARAGKRPWWPALSPLTPAERVTVIHSLAAGLAAEDHAHDD